VKRILSCSIQAGVVEQPIADADSGYDVLEAHHRRNRKPRPPNPARLNSIRQATQPTADERLARDAEIHESDSDTAADIPRARRHSKTPYGGNPALPTQLHFYPSQWRDVLEQAKWKFRIWLSMHCPFPDREKHIANAEDCIDEALAEHKADGGGVEPGIWHLSWSSRRQNTYLIPRIS
jgi:hypothetical protein